jgi:primosomal protein N'
MKYIEEAKKIADYLEENCGWQIDDGTVECICGTHRTSGYGYCNRCGSSSVKETDDDGVHQIAEALESVFKEEQ